MRPGVGAIDLVDDHDRLQAALQGLGEHEAGLRHGAFGRVDQHQGPVGHPQHALDLAAEVGVAGRVDDVDLHAAVGDGDVLGQDRDPPFALQVVGVEDLLADQLRIAVAAALAQHAIDERRLAVVDVGDNGDVADVLTSHQFNLLENSQRRRLACDVGVAIARLPGSLLDRKRDDPSSRLKFAERNPSPFKTVLTFHCFSVANSASQREWSILVSCQQKRGDGHTFHRLGIGLGRNRQPGKAEFSNDRRHSLDLESDGAVIFCGAICCQSASIFWATLASLAIL